MSGSRPSRSGIRRDLLLLAAGASVLYLVSLGARDLWQPNEPTYGQAVAEMSRGGGWLVPTVNGATFAEKPPLYFWAALVSARLLRGVGETSLRLPLAAAGAAGAILLYLMVLPYAGRGRARIAAALLATTEAWFWNSRAVQMDLLVAVSTLASVLAVLRVVDGGAPALRGWALGGLAAGLGFLAKGPVAWACPALVLLAYLGATRRLGAALGAAPLAGAAVAFAVPLPWASALLAAGQADFLREAILRQSATRYVRGFDHPGPWWYYLYYYWIDFAPWSWFAPLAARMAGRDEKERRLDLLAWLWLAAVLVFFSLSSSKRSAYMLPAAPAVAILASGLADRLLSGRLDRRAALPAIAVHGLAAALALGTAAVLFLVAIPQYPELFAPGAALAAVLASGGLALLVAIASRARARAAPLALLALVVATYLAAAVAVLPAVDRFKSARPFCERVREIVPAEAELVSYRFWSWRASYSFYLGRTIRNLESREDLVRLAAGPDRLFVLVEDERAREARETLGGPEPLARAPVGGTGAWLFSSR